jgi:hypothetical protein
MHRFFLLAAFAIASATPVVAAPCIKVRSANEKYTCMKFSKEERKKAQKLHVSLGSPYKATQAQLMRSGWKIDDDWIVDNPKEAQEGLPVCGRGFDAVCSISLKQGTSKIELSFSSTSAEMQLIGINGEP